MDLGTPLPEAAERFKRWCGKDFAFLTWGPDDIPMLKENFNVHDIEGSWLDNVYDLQKIFNKQTEDSKKQRSLEFAMEYYEIPQNLPAHDALNDAYFTALVAQKLDVEEGIKTYKGADGDALFTDVIGDADAGDDGYVTIGELLDDDVVKSPHCPICDRKLTLLSKPLHSKGQRYTFHYGCQKDGAMFLVLKLYRNFNETWRAKLTVDKASEEKVAEFKNSLEKVNAIRKKSKRRNPRKRKPTVTQGAE
jgi:hypothetical protein